MTLRFQVEYDQVKNQWTVFDVTLGAFGWLASFVPEHKALAYEMADRLNVRNLATTS
jgi:hypothetical protein